MAEHVWKDLLEGSEEEQEDSAEAEGVIQPDESEESKNPLFSKGRQVGNGPEKKRGVLRDPRSQAYVKKFFISVTEEEFSRGLLWVPEQDQVTRDR